MVAAVEVARVVEGWDTVGVGEAAAVVRGGVRAAEEEASVLRQGQLEAARV